MARIEQTSFSVIPRASHGQRSAQQPRFRAFISYSHVDERLARGLHRWLETYPLPARLAGRQTSLGAVPRKLVPIFRDRTELPASEDLDEQVRAALDDSAALVVLCSPAARSSRWVNEEIAHFRQNHPARPVLAALLAGEPDEVFPPALVAGGREPIAADFRKGGDGKLARLKLVAGLTGLGLDELVQREAQRQVGRVTAITGVALISTIILAALLVAAISARNEAERQRQQAEGLIEFMLTDLRSRLEGVGRLDILGSVNERAIAFYIAQGDLSHLPKTSLERRARALLAMGEDDQKRGRLDAARTEFQEAHRVTEALLAEAPNDVERLFTHAQSEFWIGSTDFRQARYPAARAHFRAYLDLATRMTDIQPNDVRGLRELGYAHGNICTLELASKADANTALVACQAALTAMGRVAERLPNDPVVLSDMANRHAWLADALVAANLKQQALRQRRLQVDLVDRLLQSDPLNASYRQDWMLARYSLALLLSDLGEGLEARRSAVQARQAVEELMTVDPENQDWRTWSRKIERSFPALKEH